jgi:hypothetical protein
VEASKADGIGDNDGKAIVSKGCVVKLVVPVMGSGERASGATPDARSEQGPDGISMVRALLATGAALPEVMVALVGAGRDIGPEWGLDVIAKTPELSGDPYLASSSAAILSSHAFANDPTCGKRLREGLETILNLHPLCAVLQAVAGMEVLLPVSAKTMAEGFGFDHDLVCRIDWRDGGIDLERKVGVSPGMWLHATAEHAKMPPSSWPCLRELPASFRFCPGTLILDGCSRLERLPDGLFVMKSLSLERTDRLRTLPSGLRVAGDLYLSYGFDDDGADCGWDGLVPEDAVIDGQIVTPLHTGAGLGQHEWRKLHPNGERSVGGR